MLDKLLVLLSGNLGAVSTVTEYAMHIITIFDSELEKDKDSKNAAIDCIIELLQNQKSSP